MSGTNYLLDTNVVINFLKANREITKAIANFADDAEIMVSAITKMELLGYPGITVDEEKKINNFLDIIEVIQITAAIEDQTIKLRRLKEIKLPDAIIVATAIYAKCTLVTTDKRLSKLGVERLEMIDPSSQLVNAP